MPASPRDPLAGVERLIVDGTNLLHRLGRTGAAPPAAAIGRLRAAIPGAIRIVLVFDGPPDQGGALGKVAQGMTVRYAGRRPADVVIAEDVEASAGGGPDGGRTLVASDDNALRRIVGRSGARTIDLTWLLGRLERPFLASPAAGNRRPPLPPGPGSAPDGGPSRDEEDLPFRRWRPGRGATRKVGNPRRRRPSR